MIELLKLVKKSLICIVLFIYFPLLAMGACQSLSSLYESQGAQALNPIKIWFVTKNNARIIWIKTLGVFPRTSLTPFWGENYVILEKDGKNGKWGGCPIAMDENDNPYFEVALGIAHCSNIANLHVDEDFAQLSTQQLALAYAAIDQTKDVRGGISDQMETAYAILALADEIGPVSVSEYLSQRCARALLGEEDQKEFCLTALEVEEVLNRVEVSNETERRAVAIKAGIQSWVWMASDENMAKSFWERWLKMKPDLTLVIPLRGWAGSYAKFKDSKPSMQLLRRKWSCGDLEEINKVLKKNHLNKIEPQVWTRLCYSNR